MLLDEVQNVEMLDLAFREEAVHCLLFVAEKADQRLRFFETLEACVAERAPNGFDRLEDVISQDELIAISKGYAKMAGFALNERRA